MGGEPRMTIPTQLVLEALVADPDRELYGVEIGELASLRSGTVHPILARLEGVGWLTSRWEDIDPQVEGRPPRRYYPLPPVGDHRPPGGGPPAAPLLPAHRRGSRRRPRGAGPGAPAGPCPPPPAGGGGV